MTNETQDSSKVSHQAHKDKAQALGYLAGARENLDQTVDTSSKSSEEKKKASVDFVGIRKQLVEAYRQGDISIGDIQSLFDLTLKEANADPDAETSREYTIANGVQFVGSEPEPSRPASGGGRVND